MVQVSWWNQLFSFVNSKTTDFLHLLARDLLVYEVTVPYFNSSFNKTNHILILSTNREWEIKCISELCSGIKFKVALGLSNSPNNN